MQATAPSSRDKGKHSTSHNESLASNKSDPGKNSDTRYGFPIYLQRAHDTGASSGYRLFRQPLEEEEEEEEVQAKQASSILQRQADEEEEEELIQPKLTVGEPDDEYEKEAEQVADRVMRMPANQTASQPLLQRASQTPPYLQRMCANCKDEIIQGKPDKSANTKSAKHPAINAIHSRQGGGSLPGYVKSKIEPVVGRDLSHVRVHNNDDAHRAASSINARAFTHQNHIYLGKGQNAHNLPLMAHEATHVVQQQGAGNGASPIKRLYGDNVLQRTPPNPTASAPPAAEPLPLAGSFGILSPAEQAGRSKHGMSTDTGPMVREMEREIFPTGGSRPPPTPIEPAMVRVIAFSLAMELMSDVPSLTPADAADPMTLASQSADVAMPIIASHYSPYAPSVAPATFMSGVSRKPTDFGDPVRNNTGDLAEFLEWYASDSSLVSSLIAPHSLTESFWDAFAAWIRGAGFWSAFGGLMLSGKMVLRPEALFMSSGSVWDSFPFFIRERSAVYDTYNATEADSAGAGAGSVLFGRGFEQWVIPHTVTHEAMHLFEHSDFSDQIGRLEDVRGSTDIFTEGMAEYLARGVRDKVVTALQSSAPPRLLPEDEKKARGDHAYDSYFNKVVELRNILYRHGQDGEDSVQRAFFLGEGWRLSGTRSATRL